MTKHNQARKKIPLLLLPVRYSLLAFITFSLIVIAGCEDHQERYETPPWLGGSSIETLEERGNYTIFLELMEKANYTEPISKQLFTLFVPDDDAFTNYFQEQGISSVDDLTEKEATQLFALHVLRNPRSRFQLIYEYVWDELQGPDGEYASLYHRKRTPSTSIPYTETVRYLPGFVGQERIIYTQDKNVPLFTTEWFDDYGGATDGSDYLFMYPGSTWEAGYEGDLIGKGTNWHNAQVIPNPLDPTELEVRTATGFIYFLDQVVAPMPNIEEYMIANQDRFGLYYDILQRFARYGVPQTDEQNRVMYQKQYDLVFNLANEYGPHTNFDIPAQNMWTAFLPNDQALQSFLDNGVLNFYESIDSVPEITLFYILQAQLSATLGLPSKMEQFFFNAFGDRIDLDPQTDIVSSFMCSNGVVYETNRVLEPAVFNTVPGLLFVDKNYSTMLELLSQANIMSSLSNPQSSVTLFATTNEKLEEYGVRYNRTTQRIEFRGPVDQVWSPMSNNDLINFAQDQICLDALNDLNGAGAYQEMGSGNFIYYAANQVFGAENQAKNTPANVGEISNESNGLLVKVDYPIASRFLMGQFLNNGHNIDEGPADPDVSEFAQLLIDHRLLDNRFRDPVTREVIPNLKFLSAAQYWTGFIPTNAAMAEARAQGIIPDEYPPASDTEGRAKIDRFLKYHFVEGDVIFDDGNKSGIFNTHYSFSDEDNVLQRGKLIISNSPGNLTITDNIGQVITLEHDNANTLVRKGVAHKINTVLRFE
jgi:uncharacterized surface protein with fasciclin (FAS1) repeats